MKHLIRHICLVLAACCQLGVAEQPAKTGLIPPTTKSVTYKHGETELEGYLALPPKFDFTKKTPAVLVIHDWQGLQEYAESRARQLAMLGYVAFAADVYGKGVRPVDPKECAVCAGKYRDDLALLRGRVTAALEELKKQQGVDETKLAAIGYCFGGTCVLELARSGAPVAAVVSFHGGLGTKLPAEPGTIKSRILVCHGEADTRVNAEVPAFKEEMTKSQAKMEFVSYPEAQHGFTKPGPAYQQKADVESWAAMRKLFDEVFASK
jgi:dienelactone hydrolase